MSKRGIKVSPKQADSIMQMKPPKTRKHIQTLARKLVALSRFYLEVLKLTLAFLQSTEGNPPRVNRTMNATRPSKEYIATLPFLCQPV